MRICGIILAAGRGLRFGGFKQFVELDGRQLVDRSVDATASVCDDVVVVVPPGTHWPGRPGMSVVAGGDTRTQSVRHGLAVLPAAAEVVVIHDAAHPLASAALSRAVVDAVRDGAVAAVPGLRPADIIKRVDHGHVRATVGRDDLVAVQMPQAYRADVLRAAHTRGGDQPDVLEDSVLVEALGMRVRVVPGEATNIHVTSPSEMAIAACIARHLT